MTDRRFLTLFSIGLVFLTTLPFLLGFFLAPPGETYTGIHKLTPGDFPVYFSYIDQAREGRFLFRDLYTSEPQHANLFFPFWWLIGVIGRALPFLSAPVLFQLARIVLVPVVVALLAALITQVVNDRRHRRFLLLFVIFSAGLGVLIQPFVADRFFIDPVSGVIEWPMDLWVPEAFTFLALLHSPHLLASEAFFLGLVLLVLRSIRERRIRPAVGAGACAFGLLAIHPFQIFPLLVVLAVFLLFTFLLRRDSRRTLLTLGVVGLFSFPLLLYHAWLPSDPLYATRLVQNALRFPSLPVSLGSYGLLIPFGVYGIVELLRRSRGLPSLFLLAWVVGQPLTFFVPFGFERRLTESFHFPLGIFAGIGFLAFLCLLKTQPFRWAMGGILLAILATSTVQTYGEDILIMVEPSSPVYRPTATLDAFRWLRQHAPADAVTLTDELNGLFLPAYALRTTFLGHGVETVNYLAKKDRLRWYAEGKGTAEDRTAFLKTNRIDFLLETPELDSFRTINLDVEPSLELVSRFGPTVALYRVRPSP